MDTVIELVGGGIMDGTKYVVPDYVTRFEKAAPPGHLVFEDSKRLAEDGARLFEYRSRSCP